jgi:hypothetical protein
VVTEREPNVDAYYGVHRLTTLWFTEFEFFSDREEKLQLSLGDQRSKLRTRKATPALN